MSAAAPRQPASPLLSIHLLLASLLLILMFALALGASLFKSPAVGEARLAVGGWARLHGEAAPLTDRPALPSLLGGIGLLLEPDLPAPASLEGMAEGDLTRSGADLFWGHGLPVERLILLSRLSFILLGLLLAATACRWAADLYGRWAALLTLMLLALAPGILTFTALALPDMALTAFYMMALFSGWRFVRSGSWRWLVATGVLTGLALGSGPITALLLPSLLLVLATVPRSALPRDPRLLKSLAASAAAFLLLTLIALAVLWAALGFPWQPFALAGYLERVIDLFRHGVIEGRVYFNGMFSSTGWWFYQPLVYLIKTPVPTLLVVLPAIIFALVRGIRRVELSVLIPLVLYTALMLLPRFNGGYRLLLPMVLLLSVFAARLVTIELPLRWIHPTLAALVTVSSLAINILAYPDYLAFIDLAFGGTPSALTWLGGADRDLGQDLPALARFLEQRGAAVVYLSYYGEAEPAYYGIAATPLPGPPAADDDEGMVDFYPLNPAPGLYAISASNLAGLWLTDSDWFGYFRGRPSLAQVGSSIYIYEVQPDTLPTASRTTPWAAVCAVPAVPESAARLIDLTGIEDLLFLYFDCGQSLVFPAGPGWLLLPADIDPVYPLGVPDYVARHPDGSSRYNVWLSRGAPSAPASSIEFPAVDLPLPVAGYVELLGYRVNSASISPGSTLRLLVWWRVRALPSPPVSFSAQMLTRDDVLIASADGLGIPADEWQPGMTIVQQHNFEIDPDVQPGDYVLAVGMYVPTTGRRFPIYRSSAREIDRIVLRGITVGPSR